MNSVNEFLNLIITDQNFRKQFLSNRTKTLEGLGFESNTEDFKSLLTLNVTALLIDSSQAFTSKVHPI